MKMNRWNTLSRMPIAVLALCACLASAEETAKPNILYLIVDDKY